MCRQLKSQMGMAESRKRRSTWVIFAYICQGFRFYLRRHMSTVKKALLRSYQPCIFLLSSISALPLITGKFATVIRTGGLIYQTVNKDILSISIDHDVGVIFRHVAKTSPRSTDATGCIGIAWYYIPLCNVTRPNSSFHVE